MSIWILSLGLVAVLHGQNSSGYPMLGETAPSFSAETTNGKVKFPSDFGDHWKIIFSHPADFTPVCSSEILDLATMQDDFRTMNADLLVLSTDALENHKLWKESLESVSYKDRKPADIRFPLVADPSHQISKKYGMIHPETNSSKAVRGVFIIDPQNKIRAMFYYPMTIGRNMDEIRRALAALQTSDRDQVMTPAGWVPGGDVIVPYSKYTADQENTAPAEDPKLQKVAWYLWLQKSQ